MNIPSLTSAQLKNALGLLGKKETLLTQIEKIDQQLEGIFGGKIPNGSVKRGRPAKVESAGNSTAKPQPRGRRSSSKEKILAKIQEAGAEGISLQDLSASLKMKPQNLSAWFNGTGKNVEGLQRIGRGLYALNA